VSGSRPPCVRIASGRDILIIFFFISISPPTLRSVIIITELTDGRARSCLSRPARVFPRCDPGNTRVNDDDVNVYAYPIPVYSRRVWIRPTKSAQEDGVYETPCSEALTCGRALRQSFRLNMSIVIESYDVGLVGVLDIYCYEENRRETINNYSTLFSLLLIERISYKNLLNVDRWKLKILNIKINNTM
jgi:hypothetical protein